MKAGIAVASVLLILLIMTGCSEDRGSENPDQSREMQLLQNCIDAAGGTEVLQDLKVIHTVDSISMAGMNGTTESWWLREPFMGFSSTRLGPVSQEVLMIGDSVWTVDRNGHLSKGGVEARDQMILSRNTVFYDYLFDTSMVSFGEDTLIDSVMAVPMHLEFQQEIIFYISKETWLPELMTAVTMGLEVRSYPMDYEIIQGVTTPRSSLSTIPAFGQEIRSTNLLTEYNVSIPDSIFTLGSSVGDWELEDPGSPTPFSLKGEHIYLQGEVNGERVTILLDSGAGATVLDSTLAWEMGLASAGRLPARGIGGIQEFSFVEVAVYRAAGAVVYDQVLAVMPLAEKFYPLTGERINMILGYDFLSRFVTRIDYGAEILTLFDPQDFVIDSENYTILPALRTMSLLSIKAVLEDSIPVNLLLDTGAGGSIHLTPIFFEKHPRFLENRPTFETSVQGVGGEEVILGFRISSISMGDFTVPGGLCSRFQGGDIFNQFDGILGAGILARFVVYLDYSSDRVILEPSAIFDEGLPESMTGLGLEISGNRLLIGSVISGSPGDLAGIRGGDILLEIDGKAVTASQLQEVEELIPVDANVSVALKILRDGEEIEMELTTGRLIPVQDQVP